MKLMGKSAVFLADFFFSVYVKETNYFVTVENTRFS
jgi:hypothetical protein